MFIVQCLFAKTKEAVGHHSRIVKSIFAEREHHIVPECFAQTGNLTHDCRCKYHTGGYFVIGINHEILLEIRVFQMNETGIIAFLQALDILCQIADLLFQMVGQYNRAASKTTFQTTPAKHAAEVMRTAFIPGGKQRTEHIAVKHHEIARYRVELQLIHQPIGNPYIGYIKGTIPSRHFQISIGGSRQCRIGKRRIKELATG